MLRPLDLSKPGALSELIAFHRGLYGFARMETETEPQPPVPKPSPPPSARKPDDDGLGEAGRNALKAERAAAKAEKKRADDALRELEELRRERMPEQERLLAERDDAQTRLSEATARIAALELASTRHEVAAEHGLTLAQARRLAGSTREELDADAKAFKAELASLTPSTPPPPKPDPSAGQTGSAGKPTSVEAAMRAYRDSKKTPTNV